jgi:hypothetical protein
MHGDIHLWGISLDLRIQNLYKYSLGIDQDADYLSLLILSRENGYRNDVYFDEE